MPDHIKTLTQRIEATNGEIASIKQRLVELNTLPTAPGPDSTNRDRVAHRLEVSRLSNERRPEIEGLEAAILDLQNDLRRDQAELSRLQAEATQQVRQERVAQARARIDELGGELAAAVATVQGLLGEIHEAIDGASEDFGNLQVNPHSRPPGGYDLRLPYYRWKPKPLCLGQYNPSNLPLLYQEGGSFGTVSAGVRATTLKNAEDRKRQAARLMEVTAIANQNQKVEVAQ